MLVTKENYFSDEVVEKFMDVSQFKDFMRCEKLALERIKGHFKLEGDALIQGQFVDAHFEKNLNLFKEQHPEMFKRDGTLQSKFAILNDCIQTIEDDPTMRKLCKGEQQQVFTGEIKGVPFRIMIDSLLLDRIVDRKCMKDFKNVYNEEEHEYQEWWKAYGYDIQAACYQFIYAQNTGRKLPFEIVAVSKEKVPDKRWIHFTNEYLEMIMNEVVLPNIERYQMIKEGLIEPTSCGTCDCCKSNIKIEQRYEEI